MSEHGSREIQREVHSRLHLRDGTAGAHPPLTCHSYNLNTIVWETLMLLGEWEVLELEPKNLAARVFLRERK